jgi:ABC-type proline/glycine betaine transport system permease subunit
LNLKVTRTTLLAEERTGKGALTYECWQHVRLVTLAQAVRRLVASPLACPA